MFHRKFSAPLLTVVLLCVGVVASGCGGGGGGQNAANSTATATGQAVNAAGQAMNGAAGQAAPIPAHLDCKSQIVWVNLNTHVYHEQGDPWYGRTKNGQYMCMAAVNAHGYHLAGGGNGGSMTNSMGNSSGTMTGAHHHHRNAPAPTST